MVARKRIGKSVLGHFKNRILALSKCIYKDVGGDTGRCRYTHMECIYVYTCIPHARIYIHRHTYTLDQMRNREDEMLALFGAIQATYV